MADREEIEDRARKERSPSFPFISLPKAIERAKAAAEAHRRNGARIEMLAETWGYGERSSGLQQTVAALKAYGLMEDIGRGKDRKIQLTDLAWRILHDTRPGAKEEATKEAALRPRLIAEYAEKWLVERPSLSHCMSELHLDRGFTEHAAELFLRVFDETLTFANLKNSDSLSSVSITATDLPSARGAGESLWLKMQSKGPPDRVMPAYPHDLHANRIAAVPRATLPLPEGTAAFEVPAELSRKSYEALKAWIDVMISLAGKSIVAASKKDEPEK